MLDAEPARRMRGVDADSRAFVLLRGWVRGAVTVQVNDPIGSDAVLVRVDPPGRGPGARPADRGERRRT